MTEPFSVGAAEADRFWLLYLEADAERQQALIQLADCKRELKDALDEVVKLSRLTCCLDNEAEVSSGDKASSTVIQFGKFKGRTVWDCPEHYLRWLVAQNPITEHFRILQEEAKDPLDCLDSSDQEYYANYCRWDGQ